MINKSILHILDFNSGVMVFSEKELGIQDDATHSYIQKHLDKAIGDPNAKTGFLEENSNLNIKMKEYLEGKIEFLTFSIYIAEQFNKSISQSDNLDSVDIIITEFDDKDQNYIGILVCANKSGYTHHVIREDGLVKNEIINHHAILPGLSQKLDSYAMINTSTKEIKFVDKKRYINGEDVYILPDIILECNYKISQSESIRLVNTITKKIAEQHNHNSVEAISKAKNYILENSELSNQIDAIDLGKEVFESSQVMQNEYIKEIENAGIPEKIKIDKSYVNRSEKKHKIKTDTGIEIVFPVDYVHNKDYLKFINNPDGTISIELRNIGKIINK